MISPRGRESIEPDEGPAPAEIISNFLIEVWQLGAEYSFNADGGRGPDDSEYLTFGYASRDGHGVLLVVAPKLDTDGRSVLMLRRFEGTGAQRAQAFKRWFEDW
jgi:hypothetical protein